MYPVQLVVETTRVADRMSISGATPQRRLRCVAVGTAHTSTSDHSLSQTTYGNMIVKSYTPYYMYFRYSLPARFSVGGAGIMIVRVCVRLSTR